jgi:hypothetical protein
MMRVEHLLGAVVLSAMMPAALWGQTLVRAGSDDFDIERAIVDEGTRFEPFVVSDTRTLRSALREGLVQDQTRLIVMLHDAGQLALVQDQMAYHHVAQGDIAGEPWMVSF